MFIFKNRRDDFPKFAFFPIKIGHHYIWLEWVIYNPVSRGADCYPYQIIRLNDYPHKKEIAAKFPFMYKVFKKYKIRYWKGIEISKIYKKGHPYYEFYRDISKCRNWPENDPRFLL